MLRTVWKSILAHKMRLLSTTLSIVLGVAFIAGTYVLTDTMRAAFDDLFSSTTAGIDVAVRGEAEFTSALAETDRPPVAPETLDALAAVDGVRAVSGEVGGFAVIIDDEGNPVGGQGPPTIGINAPADEELTNATLRDGTFPAAPDEVAIDAATAEAQGLSVGDPVRIVVDGPVETYTVAGIIGFGEVDNLGGATLTMFEPGRALELYGADGYTEIYAAAEDGVDVDQLVVDVRAALGDDLEVLTGDELAQSVTAEINEGLGFFTTALLVFAGVSLFVGAFLIANTFTIIVAQRTRELALLRAVGASRGQVVTSVLLEALAVGLLGSVVGLLLGLGVAQALQGVLGAFGIDLPQGDTVFALRTVVVSFVVGVGVTMVAALAPAVRSTRVPPVAALQAVAAPPARREGIIRYVLGGLVFAVGVGILALGLFSGAGISAVGAGAVVTLIGAALLSPLVTMPIVALLGTPIAASRGVPGQLAKENALRSPRRTAATASALMIGLALVSFTMIMGASIQESAIVGIDQAFLAEYQVNPSSQGAPGASALPTDTVDTLNALDEVAVATPLRFGEFLYDDGVKFLGGVDPDAIGGALSIDFLEGGWDQLDGGIVVSEDTAESAGLALGDTLDVTFAATGAQQVTVEGIFDGANIDADWLIGEDTYTANFAGDGIASIYVKLADDVSVADARPALEQALAPFPTVQLQDLDEVKQSIADQIDQLLGLLTALLGLSIIIALFGIVNTLGLSVLERTRELGLLRAVGATRPQIRTMVRWESVLIAVLGAGLGLVVGSLFGWMVVKALSDLGISQFVVPGGRLSQAVVMAALAGVLAAIVPARKAARTDVLRALEAQ